MCAHEAMCWCRCLARHFHPLCLAACRCHVATSQIERPSADIESFLAISHGFGPFFTLITVKFPKGNDQFVHMNPNFHISCPLGGWKGSRISSRLKPRAAANTAGHFYWILRCHTLVAIYYHKLSVYLVMTSNERSDLDHSTGLCLFRPLGC